MNQPTSHGLRDCLYFCVDEDICRTCTIFKGYTWSSTGWTGPVIHQIPVSAFLPISGCWPLAPPPWWHQWLDRHIDVFGHITSDSWLLNHLVWHLEGCLLQSEAAGVARRSQLALHVRRWQTARLTVSTENLRAPSALCCSPVRLRMNIFLLSAVIFFHLQTISAADQRGGSWELQVYLTPLIHPPRVIAPWEALSRCLFPYVTLTDKTKTWNS